MSAFHGLDHIEGATAAIEPPQFTLETNEKRGLLKIVLKGLWTFGTVALFREALAISYKRLSASGFGSGQFTIVADCREQGVQPVDVMAELADTALESSAVSKRTAVIVSSILQQIQIKRVGSSDRLAVFTGYDEAMTWVLSLRLAG